MKDYKDKDYKIFNKHCKKYKYYPLILPAHKRIIAIGDLHGDYDMTLSALKLGKVIDNSNNWVGDDTIVVQVGDQVDSCRPFTKSCNDPSNSVFTSHVDDTTPEDVKVLKFMTTLHDQAVKSGGMVINLLGNHEIMNVMGDMRYVSYNDVQRFKNYNGYSDPLKARKSAFRPGGELATLLACTRIPVIIIGSFIFIHAGLINTYLQKMQIKGTEDLYKISYFIRKWLLGLIDKNYVSDIVGSKDSLFWDRILGTIPPNMNNNHPKCEEYLNTALKLFKVDKMIIGHTPQSFLHNSGINKTCDDKLWRIDFGGSFGFNTFDTNYTKTHKINDLRNVQVLEILDDKIINILKVN